MLGFSVSILPQCVERSVFPSSYHDQTRMAFYFYRFVVERIQRVSARDISTNRKIDHVFIKRLNAWNDHL